MYILQSINNHLRRALKIGGILIAVLLVLSIVFSFLIRWSVVQDFVIKRVVSYVSKNSDAEITIGSFGWSMLDDVMIHELYIKNKVGDTLIGVPDLNINMNAWSIWNRTINIKSIDLRQAKIRLVTDEEGKIDLVKLFASKTVKQLDTTQTKVTKTKPWILKVGSVSAQNTSFILKNLKGKSVTDVFVASLTVSTTKKPLTAKLIELDKIAVVSPVLSISQTDSNVIKTIDTTAFHFLPKEMQLTWNSLTVTNGKVAIQKTFKPILNDGRMDFNHLVLSDINVVAQKGRMDADSMMANVMACRLKEQSGFQVKELKTVLNASLQEIVCKDLWLKTNESVITNALSFKYNHFEDFNSFLTKVRLGANFKSSLLSLRDLAYFVKGLNGYEHNIVKINGQIKGKISSLDGKGIELFVGKETKLEGDFFTSGLPVLTETFLNFRLKSLTTTPADIHRIAPIAKLPDNVYKLGKINFSGDLDGFVTDFVARGNLTTAIGQASSDLNFKYNVDSKLSAYSGNLDLNGFNLGTWFGDTSLGKVSLVAKVNGKGLKLESIDTKIEGTIESFAFKRYNYTNLKVNGAVKSKSFEGKLVINDPNVNLEFDGKADLMGAVPKYNFRANVQNVSLLALHLSKADISFKGDVVADFAGKNIDDLEGRVAVTDLTVTRDEESSIMREITISSSEDKLGQKKINIEADNLEANLEGTFSLLKLPKLLKSKFNKAVYLIDDTAVFSKQVFNFDLRIYDSLPMLRVLVPELKLIRNTFIRANGNTDLNTFRLSGNIPELLYGTTRIRTIRLLADVNSAKTTASIDADKIYLKDSLFLDTAAISLRDIENGYIFNIQAKDQKSYNKIYTDINLFPTSNNLKLNFDNTAIFLGGKPWRVSDYNDITLSRKMLTIKNLAFTSDSQSISASTYVQNDTISCLKLKLKETSLNGFMAIFSTKVKDIYAQVNGVVDIQNLFGKPIVLGNVLLENIILGEVPIGTLNLTSSLNNSLNRIDLVARLSGAGNNLGIDGFYTLDPKGQELSLKAAIVEGSLDFLNYPFFNKYVLNTKGSFRGKLDVTGPLKKLRLGGGIHINDADVTVSYLKTRYTLKDEDIELSKDGYIDIGEVTLHDDKNNIAIGRGRLLHQNLKQFTLALNVSTRNMQFLHTTAKDNSVFYGDIYGSGTVVFAGTIPQVDIRAYAKVSEGTHVFIPINSNYETNGYSFYKFTNKKLDSLRDVGKTEKIFTKGVNFTAEIDVSSVAELDIILDQTSGDILSSRGSGNIKIQVMRNGDFGIFGLYEIDRGSYLFTLQNIINKRFILNKGGTIAFNGDLKKAAINADAIYQVRTSSYDLIYDPQQADLISQEVLQRSKNRMLTQLLLKLNGVLEHPDVSFDINPIDPDPAIKAVLDNRLQIVKSTESELNKQVFGLLVMNRFLPVTSSTNAISNSSLVGGSVANTVSEFLTSQLSMYASSFFDNMNVKDLDLNLNFRQYDQGSNASNSTSLTQSQFDTRRELQLALTKRFLNNRLSINAGGNVDFGDRFQYDASTSSYVNNPNTYVTGDFQIDYALTKSGNLKVRAANKIDYDNFNQKNRNKTSLGLAYRQDFDNVYDLFKIKRKKKKTGEEELPKPVAKEEDFIQFTPVDSLSKPSN